MTEGRAKNIEKAPKQVAADSALKILTHEKPARRHINYRKIFGGLVEGLAGVLLIIGIITAAFMLVVLVFGQWNALNSAIQNANQPVVQNNYEAPTKTGLIVSWMWPYVNPIVKGLVLVVPVVLVALLMRLAARLAHKLMDNLQYALEWPVLQVQLVTTLAVWTLVVMSFWAVMSTDLVMIFLLSAVGLMLLNLALYSLAHLLFPRQSDEQTSWHVVR